MLSAPPAAAITYEYTGQTFIDFEASFAWPQPHDSGMRIEASIELTKPLAANATIDVLDYRYDPTGDWQYSASASFLSAYLSDGVNTFSIVPASGSPNPENPPIMTRASYAIIRLVTGSLGEIVDWMLWIETSGRYDLEYGGMISMPGLDTAHTSFGPYDTSASVAESGAWSTYTSSPPTEVPLPAAALLLSGAFGLLGFARAWRGPIRRCG